MMHPNGAKISINLTYLFLLFFYFFLISSFLPQQQPPPPPTSSSSADSSSSAASEASKADQINLALQKLQDTAVTLGGGGTKDQQQRQQLFVKIFCADGTTKSVLVDEVMSVGTVLEILVEKNHVQLEPSWGIVEHIPELYMERSVRNYFNFLTNDNQSFRSSQVSGGSRESLVRSLYLAAGGKEQAALCAEV
jgi:hypothetical protein